MCELTSVISIISDHMCEF